MRSERMARMAMLVGLGAALSASREARVVTREEEELLEDDRPYEVPAPEDYRSRHEARIAEYERQREERERRNEERRARMRELGQERMAAAEEKRKRKAERRAKAAAAQLRGKRQSEDTSCI